MADSSSDDDVPLAQRTAPSTAANGNAKPSAAAPAAAPAAPRGRAVTVKRPKTPVTEDEDEEDEENSEESSSSDDNSDDDVPLQQRARKSPAASARKSRSANGAAAPRAKRSRSSNKSGDDEEGSTRTRKKSKGKGSGEIMWKSLKHCGVLFPPDYTPHGVKMLYAGQPVDLTPEQEEVATMYAVMLETDYMNKPLFKKNFWEGFKEVLGKDHAIKDLDQCEFRPIYEHLMAEREKKKAMSKEEKDRIKKEKDASEAKYKVAYVDGRAEPVGNFRVEPPALFRGRGEHPKMGMIKKRIFPRDITINIGQGEPIPEHPYPGQTWKEVRHDQTVTWLAYWKDTISAKDFKYVFLGATSTFKADSDLAKYEKARKLKEIIHEVRKNYERDLDSKETRKRQMGCALYFIDKLALRAGHEKDEDEADTVGCCTLKVENVEVVPPKSIKFDFLGKDSIRYENTVEVDQRVYNAIEKFRKVDQHGKKKGPGEQLFETFDATDLNKELKNIMEGLSVKVFRTYNASITLDRLLNEWEQDLEQHGKSATALSVDHKKADYDKANKEVAILCNHQRSVPKTHSNQMEKLSEKLSTLNAELKALEKEHREALKDKGAKANPDSIKSKIDKKLTQIQKAQLQAEVKEDLKTVALGTSKINYLDPRITVAWCKRNEVPIEKIFNKSLLAKFSWAMDCEPAFRF